MRRLRALLADRAGIAALETGMVGVLAVTLLGGMADFGIVLSTGMQVTRAERAAMLYAWANSAAAPGAIVSAAQAAFPAAAVSVSSACYCLPSSAPWAHAGATAVGCATSCSAGNVLTEYLTVTVSATVALPLPLPVIAASYALAATGTTRLQ